MVYRRTEIRNAARVSMRKTAQRMADEALHFQYARVPKNGNVWQQELERELARRLTADEAADESGERRPTPWRTEAEFNEFAEAYTRLHRTRLSTAHLSDWTRAYLRDARESEAIDRDTPDAVIDREAAKLDVLIFQLASSFVDNEFNEAEDA